MDGIRQTPPRPVTRGTVGWTRDAHSNVVRIHRAPPAAPAPIGRCSYHEAALAEDRARPRP